MPQKLLLIVLNGMTNHSIFFDFFIIFIYNKKPFEGMFMKSIEMDVFCLEERIKGLEKQKMKYEKSYEQELDIKEKNRLELLIKGFERNINKRKIRLAILKLDSLLKNDEIALIKSDESLEGKYSIYKVDDSENIGSIIYSEEDRDQIGSIGYYIREKYRGHKYAYKSLKLLTSYLKENSIEKVTIVTTIDNIPSIKTMERFRGDVPSQDESRESVKRYSYKL